MSRGREPAARGAASSAQARSVRARHLRGSGDLTRRKLFPALYALAFRRLLPDVRRRRRRPHRADDEQFGSRDRRRSRSTPATSSAQEVWDELADGMRYVPTDFADDEGRGRGRRGAPRARRGARAAGNRLYYLAVPPAAFATIVDELGERRSTEGWIAADRREAVRARPRVGRRLNEMLHAALRREGDLPDRPLPRQGDGPEHAGAAVRERHLRADLEPPVHRPRPDHGRRVDRDRGPRGVLRAGRCDPRHVPEPPAPARRADRDGAADRLHGGLGPEREGEGAALAAHAGAEIGRARPVRARLHRGRGGAGVPRGAGRRSATRRPRRTSPRSSTSTTGAGRTRRSTSARASGCRGARRRSRSSSSARRIRPSRRSRATGCGRTCS